MKKLINKLKRESKASGTSNKMTAETMEEHRRQVLAEGRRFKYPLQYERHRLVFNTIIIAFVALMITTIIGWWQLYPQQNSSEFIYRITKVLPLPVATIDGQTVLYSDYLMKYRSSIYYLEQKERVNFQTEDGKRQMEHIKQQSIEDALADAYATKLADESNIIVSDEELENFLNEQRQTSDGEISSQTYNSVILDYYNWTSFDYRYVMKKKLLRQKISYEIDTPANDVIKKVSDVITKNSVVNFNDVVSQIGSNVSYGSSGWVPKTNQDGGLSLVASKLNKGEVSSVIQSNNGRGYYIIRLLDANEEKVSYEYVRVPLSVFSDKFNNIKKSDKVKIYINLKIS